MSARDDDDITGWVGWIFFAGMMMVIMGVIHAIVGFVALFNSDYLIITARHLLFLNITTWGWVHLLMGVVIFFAGFGVFGGKVWARTVGVMIAALSAIANVAFLPAYPLWSFLLIAVDFMVIYALTVHGHELAQ